MTEEIIIKTPEQIEGIRASCRLASQTLNHVSEFIISKITTNKINEIASSFITKHGATSATLNYPSFRPGGRPFPASICTSVNEVICHGVPSERILKDRDIVKVDVTTILNGYFGDTCKTFGVGKLTKKTTALVECCKKCLEIGIQQVKPGNHIGAIGFCIGRYAHACNFNVVTQFCGHGCGILFHEAPNVPHISLSPNIGPIMAPGQIFTIEPMICQKSPQAIISEEDGWTASTTGNGNLSAQFEHTVLVTENGCEILTI